MMKSTKLGNRIMIIGSCGSGKTTLAIKLNQKTELPIIHLDKEYWQAGWVEPLKNQWEVKQHELLLSECWIVDGNYGGSLDIRLEKADSVIFLDYNRFICLYRILKRWLTNLGNALNLSVYQNNTFDITLLLGPMYHLFTESDKIKCLKEAVRVTKENGIIFVAYCQFDAAMIQTGFIGHMFDFLVDNNFLDESSYLPISNPAGIFEICRKEQIDELNKNIKVQRLHYVGTDMYSEYFKKEIDDMSDVLYQKYIEYTHTICENQNLVGLSNHALDILKKL